MPMLSEHARALLIILVLSLSGCREDILHDLPETEANRIMMHLNGRSLSAEKKRQPDGKWAISVRSVDVPGAIDYLGKRRLVSESPAEKKSGSSMMSTREEQRFSHERALSHELETTLKGITGVLYARVHLSLPARDPLFGSRGREDGGSGSVLLLVDDTYSGAEEEIAAIVGGASGISRDAVSVLSTVQSAGEEIGSQSVETSGRGGLMMSLIPEDSRGAAIAGGFLVMVGTFLIVRIALSHRKMSGRC